MTTYAEIHVKAELQKTHFPGTLTTFNLQVFGVNCFNLANDKFAKMLNTERSILMSRRNHHKRINDGPTVDACDDKIELIDTLLEKIGKAI